MVKKDTRKQNRLPRARRKKKSEQLPTKIESLRGYIEIRYVRCGRANCKCSKGELHGPYYLLRWREGEQKITKYVKKSEKQTVFAAVSAYQQRRTEQHQARERNREFVREIRQNNKEFRLMLQLIREGVIKL